jgi:hypothetical protein
MKGMPKTTKPAYIRGASLARATNFGLTIESMPAFRQRVTAMGGMVEYNSIQRQRVTALSLQVEYVVEYRTSKHAYIAGAPAYEIEWAQLKLPDYLSWYANTTKPAYLRGGIVSTASKHAFIRGVSTALTSKPAFMKVGSGALSSKSAFMQGLGYATAVKHAMIVADTTARTSKPAYIWGQPGTRKHAFIHGGGSVRVTDVGTNVEWRYPATKRVTSAGTELEWRYPYWLRVTAAGLTIEYVMGASTIFKVTSVGVMLEWTSDEDEFGPQVWMIS